jgi:pyruvate kinase
MSHPPKLTKIVATMGPGIATTDSIEKLIQAGVNVFRFNYKHHDQATHRHWLEMVKATPSGHQVSTLLDLQGAEIRLLLDQDEQSFKAGDWLLLKPPGMSSSEPGFALSHPDVIEHLQPHHQVSSDDGRYTFSVQHHDGKTYLELHQDATLKHKKTLNIPGLTRPGSPLTDKDHEGIALAKERQVDALALSFITSADDLHLLRGICQKQDYHPLLIAKIETQSAIDNLKSIIAASDGVMVARGDLSVETGSYTVPHYQKNIIKQAINHTKFVITATQMLESMIEHDTPTRAEISDIANAVYDQTDAVMLSAETAIGKHPVRVTQVMSQTIAYHNQQALPYQMTATYSPKHTKAIIAHAAYSIAHQLHQHQNCQGFVVFTRTGQTAQILSRLRPHLPVFVFCGSENVVGRLRFYHSLYPFYNPDIYPIEPAITPDKIQQGLHHLKRLELIDEGHQVIILHDDAWTLESGTSSIKLATIA